MDPALVVFLLAYLYLLNFLREIHALVFKLR